MYPSNDPMCSTGSWRQRVFLHNKKYNKLTADRHLTSESDPSKASLFVWSLGQNDKRRTEKMETCCFIQCERCSSANQVTLMQIAD